MSQVVFTLVNVNNTNCQYMIDISKIGGKAIHDVPISIFSRLSRIESVYLSKLLSINYFVPREILSHSYPFRASRTGLNEAST